MIMYSQILQTLERPYNVLGWDEFLILSVPRKYILWTLEHNFLLCITLLSHVV